ncbi:MAG: hypothetical protein V1895_00950, partial [Parcubacteria group bacterium]
PTQGIAYLKDKDLLSFFSLATAAIALFHSAIEYRVNHTIEKAEKIEYHQKKKIKLFTIGNFTLSLRRNMQLTKEQLLFLPLREKLTKIVPLVTQKETPANQPFWPTFIELEMLRDDVIHATRQKTYGANRQSNSVFGKLIDVDFMQIENGTRQLLNYIQGH